MLNSDAGSVEVRWSGDASGSARVPPCSEWDDAFDPGEWTVTVDSRFDSATRVYQSTRSATQYVGFRVERNGTVHELTPGEAEAASPRPCASP